MEPDGDEDVGEAPEGFVRVRLAQGAGTRDLSIDALLKPPADISYRLDQRVAFRSRVRGRQSSGRCGGYEGAVKAIVVDQ